MRANYDTTKKKKKDKTLEMCVSSACDDPSSA